ncbi:MAG: hypothetical protein HC924_13105 [Synechococcaceae cyanobacterium SM2_3_2]|nr:hypothetical protein [Synechococcaceae cyanobacterium SM2_3_2]
MAYSDFTLSSACSAFDITLEEGRSLFDSIPETAIPDSLNAFLQRYVPLATAINSEKGRSEFIVAPVLGEVRELADTHLSLFSGREFNVDPSIGLVGFCDFILSLSSEQLFVKSPVMMIVEAKNENIIGGLGQCLASMVAAQIFNQNQGSHVSIIYGAVTSGTNWRFLKLKQKIAAIDSKEYYINEINKILGILLSCTQQPVLV